MVKFYLLYLIGLFPNILARPDYHYTYRYRPVVLYQNLQALPTLSPFLSKLQNNPPLVECFNPRGIRMSLSDMPELQSVQYEFMNIPGLSGLQPPIQRPFDGRWVFSNQMIKMNLNDQFKYRIHCQTKGESHILENSHTVTNLIPKDMTFTNETPSQTSGLCPPVDSEPALPPGYCPCPDTVNNDNNTVETRIDVGTFNTDSKDREDTTDPYHPLKQELNPDDDLDLETLGKDLVDAKKELLNVRTQLEELLKMAQNAFNTDSEESTEKKYPDTDLKPTKNDKKDVNDIVSSSIPAEATNTNTDQLLPQESRNPEISVSPKSSSPKQKSPMPPPNSSQPKPSSSMPKVPPSTLKTPAAPLSEKTTETPIAQSTSLPTTDKTTPTSNTDKTTPTSNADKTTPTSNTDKTTPTSNTDKTTKMPNTSPATQSTSTPISSSSPASKPTSSTSSPTQTTSNPISSTSPIEQSTAPTTQPISSPVSPTSPATLLTSTTISSSTAASDESSSESSTVPHSTSSTTASPEKTSTTSTENPTTMKNSPTTVKSSSTPKNSDMDTSTAKPLTTPENTTPNAADTTTVPDAATIKSELDDMAKEFQKLQELLKETQKQLKRRNLELVLVNNKPTKKSDPLKDVRDFIRDELKLKDFDKKITKAEYTKCGILFETENPQDKILILEKVNEHLSLDSKFQVNEPDFDDPNCNFSKEMKTDEVLVVQNVKVSG